MSDLNVLESTNTWDRRINIDGQFIVVRDILVGTDRWGRGAGTIIQWIRDQGCGYNITLSKGS